MQHQILFKHTFWSNYHLPNFFWNFWRQTDWYSRKKVNIWTPSGYFPFFMLKWNKQEIFKRRHEKDQKQSPHPATLLKKTLPQVFSCEFCEISKNTFFNRTPPVAVSERWKIVKPITIAENVFYTSYWKKGKWSLCKKRLYKDLSTNSCSVDVSAIKNTSSKQQICSQIPTISGVQVFSTELHP